MECMHCMYCKVCKTLLSSGRLRCAALGLSCKAVIGTPSHRQDPCAGRPAQAASCGVHICCCSHMVLVFVSQPCPQSNIVAQICTETAAASNSCCSLADGLLLPSTAEGQQLQSAPAL
jgi:hypothetical protein